MWWQRIVLHHLASRRRKLGKSQRQLRLDEGCIVRTHCLNFAAALALAVLPLVTMAQANVPSPSPSSSPSPSPSQSSSQSSSDPAASAPILIKPGPRLLTPHESRDSATQPGDLRPEHPVTPQISIPFGKTPLPATPPNPNAAKRNLTPAPAGVEDAVARCEAQIGEQVRAKCRDRLAREARSR